MPEVSLPKGRTASLPEGEPVGSVLALTVDPHFALLPLVTGHGGLIGKRGSTTLRT